MPYSQRLKSVPTLAARLTPNKSGASMGSAPVLPINHLLVNSIVPRATPRAIVTTAN